jgi:hypothetical protein
MRDTTNHGAPVPPSLVKEALLRLDSSPAPTPAPEGETPRCSGDPRIVMPGDSPCEHCGGPMPCHCTPEAPMTEFAAMAYPATDADKAICAAALAAVEQSGSLSSMEHLDALLLATHPGWCKAFLDKRGQAAFDAACKSAPPALFVGQGQSIRWKDCRDHLESLGAIVLDRSTRDQPISQSIALATSKAAFPTGVDEVVKFALQALARIRELRKDLSSRALDGSAPGGSEVGDEEKLKSACQAPARSREDAPGSTIPSENGES